MLNRNILWTAVLFAALSLAMAGCLPGAGSGDNNDDSNVQTGNNGGGNNGGGGTCTTGDDCGIIYCNCTDGGVVNARRCDNNTCAPADEVCPDACAQFGTEWDGTVSQLPEDDAGTGDDAGEPSDAGTSDASELACLDGQLEDNECNRCMDTFCCFEMENCFNSDSCFGYGQCVQTGGTESQCSEENPGGQSLWEAFISCQQTNCPECDA